MVRVITQETYDEVVAENIEEMLMSPQEAVDDAVAQFEAQGVDLSNIVKDLVLSGSTNRHLIVEIVSELNSVLTNTPKDIVKMTTELNRLKDECGKDLPHKMMASREGAYSIILKTIHTNDDLLETAVESLITLMDGNPDLLDDSGVQVVIKTLQKENCADNTVILLLKWATICCVKHEMNRQKIFDAGILTILRNNLDSNKNETLLRETCTLIRHLVLDDDIRVEYGKAHDHARSLAEATLSRLTTMLEGYSKNENFVSELLLTLSCLLVRSEYCQMVEDAGGLKLILKILIDFQKSDKLVRQSFKLLKALAGNDDVKRSIFKHGAAPLITSCLDDHKESENTAIAGLACVAALSLREQTNGAELLEAGISDVIVQCMKIYPQNMQIQRNASWTIRNLVSRNKDKKKIFLDLGVEEILNESLTRFDKSCSYDIKSALRDLGCQVKFDEQWTGKGGKIHSSSADATR